MAADHATSHIAKLAATRTYNTAVRQALVGRKHRGRLAPLGGVERPRRKVRFARLIHRRVRAFGPAFGRRRLRRRFQPGLVATQGGVLTRLLNASGSRVVALGIG